MINEKISYENFKRMISEFLKLPILEDENPWILKIELKDELIIRMDLENVWKQYNQTGRAEILFSYIDTQKEGLMTLRSNFCDYDEIKESLIPTIRSSEFLDNLKTGKATIKNTLEKNLNAVIIYDHEKFTNIIDRNLYDFLPEDEIVFKDAIDNLIKKGWVKETTFLNNKLFDLYVFEERNNHSSHFQFFINEWMDKKFGDCFIAFPTNKIAMVLKVKSTLRRDGIECLASFEKIVWNIYSKKEYPLSNVIIKYENGNHQFI